MPVTKVSVFGDVKWSVTAEATEAESAPNAKTAQRARPNALRLRIIASSFLVVLRAPDEARREEK
jgi:hypothetical protein